MTRCLFVIALLLLSAQSGHAQSGQSQDTKEDRVMKLGYVSLAAVSLADLETTGRALERPGMRERNPILRPFADKPGVVGLVSGGLSAGVGLAAYQFHKRAKANGNKKQERLAHAAIWAWTIARGFVVIHNVRELRKNQAQ